MAHTERDVMRARRVRIWREIEAQHPALGLPPMYVYDVRDKAYKKALRTARVYDHVCSPYCRMRWAKRHDKRRYRRRAKQLVRTMQFDELNVLRRGRYWS